MSPVTCADCSTPLEPGVLNCPKCGSGNKALLLVAEVGASASLKYEQRDESGFVLSEGNISSRRSRKSGRPATKSVIIDRTSPTETVKKDTVTEVIDGEVVVVHQHEDKNPAKHRPPRPEESS
jgi:hypothetical protein